ncbi:hypothetical protein TRIUR3_08258 [Triticum urartu]|uniref:Uncharacterized protein n=1 Tax=Triticum urartu TaxID=4572 RepID=M7YM56_TRIUA|nr:hypothetical protein TRIUR3_08258 [Triticum urartu]
MDDYQEEQEEERVPEPIVDGDGVVCIQPLRMVPPEGASDCGIKPDPVDLHEASGDIEGDSKEGCRGGEAQLWRYDEAQLWLYDEAHYQLEMQNRRAHHDEIDDEHVEIELCVLAQMIVQELAQQESQSYTIQETGEANRLALLWTDEEESARWQAAMDEKRHQRKAEANACWKAALEEGQQQRETISHARIDAAI